RVSHRRHPSRSRRAKDHKHDLFNKGHLRLWADEETNVAALPDRIQVEDGPDWRNRSAGQSNEKIGVSRGDIHRAYTRRKRAAYDADDRTRVRSPGLQRYRMSF